MPINAVNRETETMNLLPAAPTSDDANNTANIQQGMSDPDREAERLIALGKFDEAARIPGVSAAISNYVASQKAQIDNIGGDNANIQQVGNAAPAPQAEGQKVEIAPAPAVDASVGTPDVEAPNLSMLIREAARNSTQAFEIALRHGAGYGQEVVSATEQSMSNSVALNTRDLTPEAVTARVEEVVDTLKSKATEAFGKLVQAGSFGALYDMTAKLDVSGAALGQLPPTTQITPEKLQEQATGFAIGSNNT